MDMMDAKARLLAMRDDLKARQKRLAVDLDEPLNADSAEQASEVQDDRALEQQSALVAREIGSVNRALARIEAGVYGACLLCGEPIAPARLAARPEASLCIACARKEQ
ncbi:RNA polymerase-binding transcription factor DksA [Sphingobium sp. B11D3D]|uniref:TraR/DksA family transcriptional regulator n=2 Tax=unclassified Sphingobium TaxID=2611147 RepID=UPI002224DCE3|nr:TraR/DksA family transcriptional regulator [Sphingobium sp. B12D2B]MCW2350515.1 RNA polymerase-binding transcription factor DksA [Sphingobium sp. B12D2B]MCW2369618.1 RNA polymerase-binding transcription factor DksA [Sphingobium sp. B11D3D]